MLDLKIVGGTVVDGSGEARRAADVGIRDGRIVALGEVSEDAARTIDAVGRIVAPGFIDAHTHYDAQVFWDPKLSPSCFHGITTVFGGFCGFSIAPITPDSANYIKPMLARVEGMPLATLEAALPWNWSSFGEYLERIDGRIGVNAGFFAGHSAIRRVVMGERAVGAKATPEDVSAMQDLLGRSITEGAMGFSTSVAPTHNDGDGNPVPSRWADHSEIIALASVVKDHPGTSLELLPHLDFAPEMRELLAEVSIAGNRPVNWNVLAVTGRKDSAEIAARQLEVSDYARSRGGEVLALTIPCSLDLYMNLRTGFTFDALPGEWSEVFKHSIADRMAKFRDPAFRDVLEADAARQSSDGALEAIGRLADYTVVTVQDPSSAKYEGRRVGEIAAAEGKRSIDVMLDIALADDLGTTFLPDLGGYDRKAYELRGKLWDDDRTLIGGSDAGAHLDMIDTFAFSTMLLEKGVREHKIISLEKAVNKITHRQAIYFGLIDRGLVAVGYHADIVIFDEHTIAQGAISNRFDIPGGNDFRIYSEPDGIDHVLVNGVEIVRKGHHTGALPGKVIKSGVDTATVEIDALRHKAKPECV